MFDREIALDTEVVFCTIEEDIPQMAKVIDRMIVELDNI